MPRLTRWFLRSGIACLLLSLALGAWPVHAVGTPRWLASSWPVQLHLLTFGWLTQVTFGVAWWLFPRAGSVSSRHEAAMWLAFGALQAGLLLRVIFEPLGVVVPAAAIALPVSAALQFTAALAFAIAIWPRIRAR